MMTEVTFDKDGLAEADGTVTVYNYSAGNAEYTGSSIERFLVGIGAPAHSTTEKPPETSSGNVAVYVSGKWRLVADHRGETVYSTNDGRALTIVDIGDYPDQTTIISPSTEFDKWNGVKWVTDEEAQKKDSISSAGIKKKIILSEVNEKTQAWQTQLLLGIISDNDKATLTGWMKYYQQVQALDILKAPDIDWPQQPQ